VEKITKETLLRLILNYQISMPKPEQFQLSGVKKYQIAKHKSASERSGIAFVPRLELHLVHSLAIADDRSRNIDSI
jgi:hypothetical protein